MMSSSELQRIALATSKAVTPQGTISVDQLQMNESVQNDDKESVKEDYEANAASSPTHAPAAAKRTAAATSITTTSTSSKTVDVEHSGGLSNGIGEGNSPNKANETISSSIGDITVDSVRDHLNATTTTLCSTTTEETVGKILSPLWTKNMCNLLCLFCCNILYCTILSFIVVSGWKRNVNSNKVVHILTHSCDYY